jgi:hypothetical protein
MSEGCKAEEKMISIVLMLITLLTVSLSERPIESKNKMCGRRIIGAPGYTYTE